MMKIILWISFFTLVIVTKVSSLDNLSICLDGKYSILCKYELLTDSQKREAKKADKIPKIMPLIKLNSALNIRKTPITTNRPNIIS